MAIQHIAGEAAATMAAYVANAVILVHRTRDGIRPATKVHAEGASIAPLDGHHPVARPWMRPGLQRVGRVSHRSSLPGFCPW